MWVVKGGYDMQTLIRQLVNDAKDGESVTDVLLHGYLEKNVVDEESIKQSFAQLDEVLSRLTLKEYDRVWDATCRLCNEHERRGFLSGLRIGVSFMLEIEGNNQRKDSCF